jgi:hypothetical protein
LLKTAAEKAILPRHGDRPDGKIDARRQAMKTLTIAAVLLGLIALPAHAQMNGKRHQNDEKAADPKKPKVDEKAYKAALEKIPDSKEKYDPWGVARPTDPVKKPK